MEEFGSDSSFDYDVYSAEEEGHVVAMVDHLDEHDCEEENPLSSKKFLEKRLVNAELALCSLNLLGFDTKEYHEHYGSAILPAKSLNLNVNSFDTPDDKLLLVSNKKQNVIIHHSLCNTSSSLQRRSSYTF